MPTITLESGYMYITKECGKQVRYNLRDKCLEAKGKRIGWRSVAHQYEFFRSLSISDLQFDEKHKKFQELLSIVRNDYWTCYSVSTFFIGLGKYLHLETYLTEGVKFDNSSSPRIPLNKFGKTIVKFFKKYEVKVTSTHSSMRIHQPLLMEQVVNYLDTSDFTNEEKAEYLKSFCYGSSNLSTLVEEYRYDLKSLMSYCVNYMKPFENKGIGDTLTTLKDYYRMSQRIGRNVKKYPKYLASIHDIITANYNSFKKDYDEKKFLELSKPHLEFSDKNFCIVIPKESKDVIREGTDLNHCVSSYVDNILQEKTYIMFLRTTEDVNKSLITLEYKDKTIVQAKGACNRALSEDEQKFLSKYCEKKKITCEV